MRKLLIFFLLVGPGLLACGAPTAYDLCIQADSNPGLNCLTPTPTFVNRVDTQPLIGGTP